MESPPQKTLERYVSQKALQMSSSFPCQICVASFLCGVCVTYFSLAALGSFGTVEFGTVYSAPSMPISQNSTSLDRDESLLDIAVQQKMGKSGYYIPKENNIGTNLPRSLELDDVDGRVSMLHSAWSTKLEVSENKEHEFMNSSNLPDAPHLEDCKMNMLVNQRIDSRGENGSFPPWTIWKGLLGLELLQQVSRADQQQSSSKFQAIIERAYPPWILGSDEDNIPYTRRVQHDIWVHQHPPNCSDSQVHFLVADWERLPGFGIGAQIAGMCGLLAIAIKEKRVLVTNYFNRADHNGCKGPSRSHWSCYFFPETSKECQDRAFSLMTKREAWETGIVTGKVNYTSKEIWSGQIPSAWGRPWSYLQPTTEIDGSLLMHHRKMDRRWWRAQAVRYLMRFQSKYTCDLLNTARHEAFGMQAARMVLASLGEEWPEVPVYQSRADIEHFVWSNHKPWMPRPLLSIHVRMGDKASEMKVVGFEEYMVLAERIRKRFPDLNAIWLSTEMQEVIDQTKLYPHWNFYYTNVPRQAGNMTMAAYEASLGRVTSTNYPLTNFLMASEADFFIGALGSTWCFLIDGMRTTGGKVMAGYLSVNKDRFW